MGGKARKHPSLIVRAQVEEAVPRQNAVEPSVEVQLTHVRHMPFVIRKAFTAEADHGGRCIYTNDAKSAIDEVASDRLAHPTTHVENRPSNTNMDQKPIQPRAFLKRSTAIAIEFVKMTLV
jgi:hypothetical protein